MTDYQATQIPKETRRRIWLTVLSIALVVALFLGLFLNKMLTPRIMSPAELRINGAIVFDQPRIIRDISLVDQEGELFTLDRLKDKWSLIFFGFTHCPDICPAALAKLAQVHSKLDPSIRDKTQIIMLSLDPARDTPAKLKQYVAHFSESFLGISGDFLQIMRFTRDLNVAFNKVPINDSYTIDHSGNIVLINPYGHYHGFFKPPFELAKLKTSYQSIVTQF